MFQPIQSHRLTIVQIQISCHCHLVKGSIATMQDPVEDSVKAHACRWYGYATSHSVENSATVKSTCRGFSSKQFTLQQSCAPLQRSTNRLRFQICLQRVQPHNKSPCREFDHSQVTLQSVQLQTSKVTGIHDQRITSQELAINKLSHKQFGYTQVTQWRVQL